MARADLDLVMEMSRSGNVPNARTLALAVAYLGSELDALRTSPGPPSDVSAGREGPEKALHTIGEAFSKYGFTPEEGRAHLRHQASKAWNTIARYMEIG